MRFQAVPPALVTLLALLAASGGGGSTTASYPYPPHGTVRRASQLPWDWIRDDPSLPALCGVQDNRWNQVHAPAGDSAQRVFVEEIDGTPAFGWQWLWPVGDQVVTYPEVICGTKPWDMGDAAYTLGDTFPFRPADHTLTVSYDLALESTGLHNVAFSLWAVSDTDRPLDTMTNEIMIWIDDRGMIPAGARVGTVISGDTTFDVWVKAGHTDASGSSAAVWTYTALVAQAPLRAGPLDLTPLLDWLATHDLAGSPGSPGAPILPAGAWIGDLELGTEIVYGGGLAEITGFALTVGDR